MQSAVVGRRIVLLFIAGRSKCRIRWRKVWSCQTKRIMVTENVKLLRRNVMTMEDETCWLEL
jgi:hypothetical protein